MPFSRSSNAVTVTGTETIHNFYADAANGSDLVRQGHSDLYQYYAQNYHFIISAGAEFIVDDCFLSFGTGGSRVKFDCYGTLTIGSEDTVNSLTEALDYRVGVDCRMDTLSGPASDNNSANIMMRQGSTFKLLGGIVSFKEGTIKAHSTLNGLTDVTWVFKKARIHNYGLLTTGTTAPRVNINAGPITIDELTISSSNPSFQFVSAKNLDYVSVSDLVLIGVDFYQFNCNYGQTIAQQDITGFDIRGNGSYDIVMHQLPTNGRTKANVRLINSNLGNSVTVANKQIATGSGGDTENRLQSLITINGKAVDASSVSVENVGMYLIDTDSGERNQPENSGVFAGDQEYTSFSDSSGDFTEILALINLWDRWYAGVVSDTENTVLDIRTPFIQRIRKAGYNFIEQTLNTDKPAAQSFTLRNNPDYTQLDATAQAHTGITITEGTFTNLFGEGKTFSIKIVGDKSVNPSLTAEDIYHYLQYHLAQVDTTFNGQLGGYWHDMLRPSGADYQTITGEYGGSRTVKGVCVVDENDALFPGVTSMTSDDESIYIPPVSPTLTITGHLVGASVVIYDDETADPQDMGTELARFDTAAASVQYAGTAGNQVMITMYAPGYKAFQKSYVIAATDATYTIEPELETN